MQLTVLGKYGPFPKCGGGTSAYLYEKNKTKLMLDCGSGGFSKLCKITEPINVDALILSHLHYDHIADLGVLDYYLSVRKKRLKFFISDETNKNFNSESFSQFDFVKIEENKVYEINGLSVAFYKMNHPVRCYGMLIDDGKTKFAYTGDTNVCDNVEKLFALADVVLCDACFMGKDYLLEKPHMSIELCSKFALKYKVKAIFTHINPDYDEKDLKNLNLNGEIACEGKTYLFDE